MHPPAPSQPPPAPAAKPRAPLYRPPGATTPLPLQPQSKAPRPQAQGYSQTAISPALPAQYPSRPSESPDTATTHSQLGRLRAVSPVAPVNGESLVELGPEREAESQYDERGMMPPSSQRRDREQYGYQQQPMRPPSSQQPVGYPRPSSTATAGSGTSTPAFRPRSAAGATSTGGVPPSPSLTPLSNGGTPRTRPAAPKTVSERLTLQINQLETHVGSVQADVRRLRDVAHDVRTGMQALPTREDVKDELRELPLFELAANITTAVNNAATPVPERTAQLAADKVRALLPAPPCVENERATTVVLQHLLKSLGPLDELRTAVRGLDGLPGALQEIDAFKDSLRALHDKVDRVSDAQAAAAAADRNPQGPAEQRSAEYQNVLRVLERIERRVDAIEGQAPLEPVQVHDDAAHRELMMAVRRLADNVAFLREHATRATHAHAPALAHPGKQWQSPMSAIRSRPEPESETPEPGVGTARYDLATVANARHAPNDNTAGSNCTPVMSDKVLSPRDGGQGTNRGFGSLSVPGTSARCGSGLGFSAFAISGSGFQQTVCAFPASIPAANGHSRVVVSDSEHYGLFKPISSQLGQAGATPTFVPTSTPTPAARSHSDFGLWPAEHEKQRPAFHGCSSFPYPPAFGNPERSPTLSVFGSGGGGTCHSAFVRPNRQHQPSGPYNWPVPATVFTHRGQSVRTPRTAWSSTPRDVPDTGSRMVSPVVRTPAGDDGHLGYDDADCNVGNVSDGESGGQAPLSASVKRRVRLTSKAVGFGFLDRIVVGAPVAASTLATPVAPAVIPGHDVFGQIAPPPQAAIPKGRKRKATGAPPPCAVAAEGVGIGATVPPDSQQPQLQAPPPPPAKKRKSASKKKKSAAPAVATALLPDSPLPVTLVDSAVPTTSVAPGPAAPLVPTKTPTKVRKTTGKSARRAVAPQDAPQTAPLEAPVADPPFDPAGSLSVGRLGPEGGPTPGPISSHAPPVLGKPPAPVPADGTQPPLSREVLALFDDMTLLDLGAGGKDTGRAGTTRSGRRRALGADTAMGPGLGQEAAGPLGHGA